MKFKILFLTVTTLIQIYAYSQTVEELYKDRDYQALIKFADKSEELSKDQLYCVGYAFFQLENDKKAIEMYDKAIAKGLDKDYIYLYKGLSLQYDKQYKKAIDNFKIAIQRNPKGQKNYTELANVFYDLEKYDSALVYLYKARELEFQLGDPYFKIPYIFHLKENFPKALEEYKISASLINKNDPKYIDILMSIGQLEYTVFKNYNNAIETYSQVIKLLPDSYDLYPKLIKAYYANENYTKGDSLFKILKTKYDEGRLPEELQKYGSISISEFEWNEQKVTVYRYFKETKEPLDIMYKVYLISKDGKSIERTLMTEKTLTLKKDGATHLLCEREKSGLHHTYPYGWSTDEIDYVSLKQAAIKVFEEKIQPSASSNFGGKSKKRKNK